MGSATIKTPTTFLHKLLCQLKRKRLLPGTFEKRKRGFGSISEKPTKPEREIFWQQASANLQGHNLSASERAKIEAALAKIVPQDKKPHGEG
jgi:hypothetical protein